MQIAALNELHRRDAKEAVLGFGKRTISGSGTVAPSAAEDDGNLLLTKKTKKNMSKVQCKACGQVSWLASRREVQI